MPSELDNLMDAADKAMHSCDLCGAMICEFFDKPEGDILPGRYLDDLWMCEACAKHETK